MDAYGNNRVDLAPSPVSGTLRAKAALEIDS